MSQDGRITHVKQADWVVGFDGERHRYLRDADVVWQGDELTFVGKGYTGPADEIVDGSGMLVHPGLINTHGHASMEALKKGLLEDRGSRKLGMSGLFEYPLRAQSREDVHIALRVGLTEMLRSGCTTVLEEGRHDLESVAVVEASGIRAYPTRIHANGFWYTENGHRVDYDLDDARGEEALDTSVQFIRDVEAMNHPRLNSMLSPLSPDACSKDLLKATREVADREGWRVHVHCSQSVVEFNEMIRRHGQTPPEVLDECGLLAPDVSLGHLIFLNDHPWIQFQDADDFELVKNSGANVDYAPWVFGRRGIIQHSFARWARAGVNVSLGTDSYPQDMMHVMRWAAIFSKIADRDPYQGNAAQVFDAATLGGARTLGRDDLGRLAPGAKADVVMVDLDTLWMRPVYDPLRSLVFSATSRAVKHVFVGGERVVDDGRILTQDEDQMIRDLQAAAERTLQGSFPELDWAKRSPDEAFPLTYEPWDGVPANA
jgi:cytosine/adenosine deaminase-related metal-dependent hydrolase